jgi:hypothetical protein
VAAANINPTFLGERHRLKPALREWYTKDNVHLMDTKAKVSRWTVQAVM